MPWTRRRAQHVGDVGVVAGHEPALAEAAEILGREEAEAGERPRGADAAAARVGGADRLRGVLDERDAERGGDRLEAFEVGGAAEEVHGQERRRRRQRRAARSASSGVRFRVAGSTSAKTGSAPRRATQPAVAKNV